MIINYTSTVAVAILKKNDHQSFVHMYSLSTHHLVFKEAIGRGIHTQCIKCNEIEQNSAGNKFAICYMDDGKFFVRVFGMEQRDIEQVEREELKICDVFSIDDYSRAISDFPDPFITCTFISDTKLFVNFFYTFSQIHCHFIWDFVNK
jgi:hypothetical protein